MTTISSMSYRGVSLSRFSIAFAFLCLLFLFRNVWLPTIPVTSPIPHLGTEQSKTAEDGTAQAHQSSQADCKNVPGADRVLVILKTGATEIFEKLPEHFLTLFRCTPNYLIYSDLEQTISDHPIHDAIAGVSDHYKNHHEDFELYRQLQQYYREGQDFGKLKGDSGWNLDKWKFLPMLHDVYRKAERMEAKIDWFVYIEADTSLSWNNLLLWLKKMDPGKPHYLGAQNVVGETTFAHGGSGFVMSRTAAKKLEDARAKGGEEETKVWDEKWEKLTSESCCGDEIVARALLKEVGVPLTPSWPLIQGETVSSIDWTDNHWCALAVTWHHVTPSEVDSLWQFQMNWVEDHGWDTPYLYADVFTQFISRHITVNRTNWNNLSADRKLVKPSVSSDVSPEEFHKLPAHEQRGVDGFDECGAACTMDAHCVQWMYAPGRCHLGKDIRLGKSDDREQDHWKSGWVQERVSARRKMHQDCGRIRWHG
ncbi:hypothetical protein LTR66_006008 [Elasticomyces elasticus]|nr:hypothetical protein LTR66_006008 [Elasticomyces elasticus]